MPLNSSHTLSGAARYRFMLREKLETNAIDAYKKNYSKAKAISIFDKVKLSNDQKITHFLSDDNKFSELLKSDKAQKKRSNTVFYCRNAED